MQKKIHKDPYAGTYFTTLSLIDKGPLKIDHQVLKAYLDKFEKYIFVLELGENRDNPHFHCYVKTDYASTDIFTHDIKQKLYQGHPDFKSKRLVRTEKMYNSMTKAFGLYCLKEDPTIEDVFYKGYDSKTISTIIKRNRVNKHRKSHIRVPLSFITERIYDMMMDDGVCPPKSRNDLMEFYEPYMDKIEDEGYEVINFIFDYTVYLKIHDAISFWYRKLMRKSLQNII